MTTTHHHLAVVTDDGMPSREEYVGAVFGPDGFLAQHFERYEPRAGQIALAQACATSLAGGNHLFAEGPTGTGKSLGYCVPASFEAACQADDEEGVVVIATANIALQEQLVQKDLPLLREILPWVVDFSLLKGFANYLCLDEMYLSDAKRGRLQLGDANDRYEQIREWAETTTTGDRNELPFEPGAEWAKFSTSRDDCKGNKCDLADECFARRAQSSAKAARIIVTNYHLLFAHLKVLATTDGNVSVLPPGVNTIIMDEAHKAADIARDFFGFELRVGQCRKLARKLDGELGEDLESIANGFFMDLDTLRRDPRRYKTRLRKPGQINPSELIAVLDESRVAFRDFAASFGSPPPKTKESKRQEEAKKAEGRCANIMLSLKQAANLADDPDVVYHLEGDNRGTTLRAKVVNIAPILEQWLFGRHKVICTSATLANAGGSFAFVMRELGAPKEQTDTLVAESPFDHARQGLLVVPKTLPMPTQDQDAYRRAVVDLTLETIELARGRTLCLFTSYRNLGMVRDALFDCPYPVLVQGDAPRTQLIERFKAETNSVLLGTESFWAGVDVPGEALSCVVIDRIPFPTPEDPVLDAISAHDDRWFFTYSVPRAQIQLKQGVGRLIRSVHDRGVIVMLDRRLIDKSYGRQFVRALPPYLRSRRLESVREFLDADRRD